MLREVRELLSERNMALVWDESLVDYLVKKAYSVTYGARNLRRLIQKEIEDVVAAKLVDRRGEKVSEIALSSDGEKINIELK